MTDILVLGATGYTGRLIAEYLNAHPERASFSLGIGARSKAKLAKLKEELGFGDNVKLYKVDTTKFDEIQHAVQEAKVIINCVGPFWRWGTEVVRACALQGKHYVDISGEPHFIQGLVYHYDYVASKKRACIIPACGVDSVPSDLAIFLSNKALKALAGPDTYIEHSVSAFRLKGSLSGGTVQTIMDIPPSALKVLTEDYSLSFGIKGPSSPRSRLVYELPFSSPPVYGGMFLMTACNRAIVQRTWALNEMQARTTSASPESTLLTYGPRFKYEEFMVMPTWASSLALTLSLWFGAICMMIPPVRWLVKQFLPRSGEGPSAESRKNGYVEVTNVTSSVPTASKPSTHVRTVIKGRGDAYTLSAVMAAEGALALHLSHSSLPALGQQGGVLTPATALGDVLVRRLEESGRMTFESEVVLGRGVESRKDR